jgi:hypothetical protein
MFEPSVPYLVDRTDKQVAVGYYVQSLDGSGSIDVAIPVTDDPDFLPSGWSYTVTIVTQDPYDSSTKQVTTFVMELPTDVNPLDLSTVVPLAAIPAPVIKPWAPISNYDPNATGHWSAVNTDGTETFPVLSVRQQTEDVFQLRGLLQVTGAPSAGETAFVLPAGYAPSNPGYIRGALTIGGIAPFRVQSDGKVVSTEIGTTSVISLDGTYYLM